VCTVRIHHDQIEVICKQVGISTARGARTVIALSHGQHVVGWGAGVVGRPIALHHLARLRGRYTLTASVVGGPRTTVRVRF
jgi:hypothetical protein